MRQSSHHRDPRESRASTARRHDRHERARKTDLTKSQHDFPLHFLSAFMREPFKVGAVLPSSRVLSRVVVDCCDIKPGDVVVELGPGTGPFTGLILKRLNSRGRLLAVEINATHAAILRRRFPQCEVIHDSAENLADHLNGERADCIVSGLAWGNMLPQMQNQILRAILKSLKPGGQFVAFAYVHAAWLPTSRRFRQGLQQNFKRVETTPIVWRNLPPAFVFRCLRA
jgi:phosphatidylethanolamine/phosphatidyl-N-methylethanolamine N-methyltransferase